MTALPDWMVLPPDGMSAAEYDDLPEDVSSRIEIVDGAIVVNASPRRIHQNITWRLANVLDEACPDGLAATIDVDLRLRDVPLLNRRADVVVYDASLPDDEVLRPEHCRLVVEVMSPGSVTADQTDKPAEYALAGIAHFWRIEYGEDGRGMTVFRYRLDPTTRTYACAGADVGKLVVSDPFAVTVDLAELL